MQQLTLIHVQVTSSHIFEQYRHQLLEEMKAQVAEEHKRLEKAKKEIQAEQQRRLEKARESHRKVGERLARLKAALPPGEPFQAPRG